MIARKAGMSKPNLLYYFRHKEDMYVTVLQQTLQAWLVSLQDIKADGNPLDELAAYIRSKLESAFRNPAASRLYANEILQGGMSVSSILRDDISGLLSEKAALISRWMDEGKLAPCDPYHLIFSIWATTQHYSDYETQIRLLMGDAFYAPDMLEKTIEAITTIILNGVRPR